MTFIEHAGLQVTELAPGLAQIEIAGPENGTENLTVREVAIAPGSRVPLHIHPTHQECIVILEGSLEGIVAEERKPLQPGHTILAPTGIVHGITNTGTTTARILAIYPTSTVTREWA